MSGFVGGHTDSLGVHNSDESLDSDFNSTMKLIERLDNGGLFPLSREFRILHSNCLESLVRLQTRVEQLHLFSPNESIEDVNTKGLRYFNLMFYLAKIIEQTPIDPSETSVDARMSVGHLAARKYIEFISLLKDYGITVEKQTESILESVLPHGIRGTFNLSSISRFKTDRRSKVEFHRQLMKYTQAYEEAKQRWLCQGLADEDVLRDMELSRLEFHLAKAWGGVDGIVDELKILSGAANNFSVAPLQERQTPYIPSPYLARAVIDKLASKEGASFDDVRADWESRNRPTTNSGYTNRVEDPADTQLTGDRGEVRRPFIITSGNAESRRANAFNQVFGTGQRLPTISIEELVEKELANRAKPELPKPEVDEDRDDVADALTMKARKWDDFTDSVAKGSGNTLNLG